MADTFSDHEIVDNEGSSIVYSGTATTTPANVPASAGNIISGFAIKNTGTGDLRISMDGGTTTWTLEKREFFSWNLKGNIRQLIVDTASGSTTYQIVINFEVD